MLIQWNFHGVQLHLFGTVDVGIAIWYAHKIVKNTFQ